MDYNADKLFYGDFENYLKELKSVAACNGVFFNQAHAPFPSYQEGNDNYNKMIEPRLIRSIEAAGVLGVKNIVIHPVDFRTDKKQRNLDMYNKLAVHAKSAGVKIAIENIWGYDDRRNYIVHNVCSSPEELIEYYDCLDPSVFTVCLDVGHCSLVGEDELNFINKLGRDRLGCLHVHDNDFKHDMHIVPFLGKLDWNKITRALADIEYTGELTLEADNTFHNVPEGFYPILLKFMHDTGRYIIKMIESNEDIK